MSDREFYKKDLAYIHDVGFGDYALNSAPGILALLKRNGIQEGLIVDLGCGSGLLAQVFVQAQYRVLGIDLSAALLEIARTRVPEAEFQEASLFSVEIPPCNAVTSVGECFNYLFDAEDNLVRLTRLFLRIYTALAPGGILIFDMVEPGQTANGTEQRFVEGEDWLVLVDKEETRNILTRRILTFRQVGEFYQRDEEIHRQQLFPANKIVRELEKIGFQVRAMHHYGDFSLPKARVAFIALKAAQ